MSRVDYMVLAQQQASCGLSHISYVYLRWEAMWGRLFRQRANIGTTRSCLRWYVRKRYLT